MHNLVLAENAVGKFYLPQVPQDIIIQDIWEGRIYDQFVIDKINTYAREGSVGIDLGANIGQMSVALSKICKTVYSVEADSFMASVLDKNLSLNSASNCYILTAAAWNESGKWLPYPEPDLVRFDSLGSYGVIPNSDTENMVISLALDDLNLDDVSFIKVDVQGADLKAMQGLEKTILRCKPAIIFEYEEIFNEAYSVVNTDYDVFLESIGYKIVDSMYQNFLALPKTTEV